MINEMETVRMESSGAEELAAPPFGEEFVGGEPFDPSQSASPTALPEGEPGLPPPLGEVTGRSEAGGREDEEPPREERGIGKSTDAPDPMLADVKQFAAHFPGVRGEDIPGQVWDMVRGGLPLTAAYAIFECRVLRFEVEMLKQNAAARARSTGSMSGLGERAVDPLDEGWYDD